ncbi:MAG: hypothetical protein SPJ97_06915, partial [Bacteroides sp.]|nr:hypothetical protein [Bacteroides sp.]
MSLPATPDGRSRHTSVRPAEFDRNRSLKHRTHRTDLRTEHTRPNTPERLPSRAMASPTPSIH